MTHGVTGYVSHRCRCDVCVAAKRASNRISQANRLQRQHEAKCDSNAHRWEFRLSAWICQWCLSRRPNRA